MPQATVSKPQRFVGKTSALISFVGARAYPYTGIDGAGFSSQENPELDPYSRMSSTSAAVIP